MNPPGMSSRKLALIAFAANLVLCGLIGTSLLFLRARDDHAAAGAPTATATSSPAAEPTPTKNSEPSPPPSTPPPTSAPPASTPAATTQIVSGPGGLTTKIPVGWTAKVRSGGTDAQATNPKTPTSFLRYGGSPSPARPLADVMRNAERSFSTTYPGYTLIALRPGTWRGHESVSWQFEFDTPDGRKHVESVYWRTGGHDYVLYASSLLTNWPAMKGIYTTAYNATSP